MVEKSSAIAVATTTGGVGLYDYGAWYYDAAIARWTSADPLAEDYAAWSPYNYVLGNPIWFIAPDGRETDDIIRDEAGNVVYVTDGTTANVSHPSGSKALLKLVMFLQMMERQFKFLTM